jgi:hypothetical protein
MFVEITSITDPDSTFEKKQSLVLNVNSIAHIQSITSLRGKVLYRIDTTVGSNFLVCHTDMQIIMDAIRSINLNP